MSTGIAKKTGRSVFWAPFGVFAVFCLAAISLHVGFANSQVKTQGKSIENTPAGEVIDVVDLKERLEDLERVATVTLSPDGEVYREGFNIVERFQTHTVAGTAKLTDGVDTITLNSSPLAGRRVVSFLDKESYFGCANPVNPGVLTRLAVIPISGRQFIIQSSSGTDTITVRFRVQGE